MQGTPAPLPTMRERRLSILVAVLVFTNLATGALAYLGFGSVRAARRFEEASRDLLQARQENLRLQDELDQLRGRKQE